MADNTVTKTLSYDGKEYEVVREGLAEILNLRTPPRENGGQKPSQTVFYNPIQQFNRDLSVLAIRTFAEHLAYSRRLRKEKETRRPKHAGRKGQRKTAEATAVSEHGSKRKRDADEEVTDEPQVKSAKREAVNEGSSGGVNGDGEEATNQHSRDHDQELDGVPKGPKGDGQSVDKDIQSNKSRFRILDALSATGLRALRYAKEIPSATDITSNDLSPSATESVKTNIRHNDVAKIVHPTTGDARAHMYESASASLYHVIDLDPYGTAAPFFDAAVQALADGGLLCVTCTDAGVFASVGYLEKTYSQYNGLPFKGTQSHEGGLRLILHAIATSAARYGMAIEPLLSLSIDFYARVFVRIRKSPAEVKFLASKTMLVYNCDSGCGAWTTQNLAQTKERQAKNGDPCYAFSLAQGPSASPYCEHCGFKTHVTGPMWGGPLHNPYFIQKILDILPSLDKEVYGTTPRLEGMLTLALNETIFDDPAGQTAVADEPLPVAEDLPFPSLDPKQLIHHPFFILPSQLAKVVHSVAPSDAAFRGALLHLGYRTTRSHTKPGSIVTDAPWTVIWEVMREWVRQKAPIKEGGLKEGMAGWKIMRDHQAPNLRKAKLEVMKATECDDIEDLRTRLEALLYRMGVANGVKGEDASSSNDLTESRWAKDGQDPSSLTIKFDEVLGKEPVTGKRLVRYPMNPRPDWGPMNKASG